MLTHRVGGCCEKIVVSRQSDFWESYYDLLYFSARSLLRAKVFRIPIVHFPAIFCRLLGFNAVNSSEIKSLKILQILNSRQLAADSFGELPLAIALAGNH